MKCVKCRKPTYALDDTKIKEIRLRVPIHLKDEFYAACGKGNASRVIREMIANKSLLFMVLPPFCEVSAGYANKYSLTMC